MNYVWIGERVSVVDVEQLLRNVLMEKPEKQWGPNSTFKYPLRGGTGFLYEGMRRYVEHKLELNTPVVAVDPDAKVVTTADGRRWEYDVLLSTMPLNHLVERTEGTPDAVRAAAADLVWSGSHIVGIGVDRPRRLREELDLLPRARRPLLPGHLPVELLPLPDRRPRPVQPAHRDVDVAVQARGRDDDRGSRRRRARHDRPARRRGPRTARRALALLPAR